MPRYPYPILNIFVRTLRTIKKKAIKKFDIPAYYRSSVTGRVKEIRKQRDPRKRDFTPAILDFGAVQFYLARHFGFCYGVENAIEISYKAIEENPGKRIFLLSQIIHNQEVNEDLLSRGVQFIMDTDGSQYVGWEQLKPEDIVIVPAFGTTLAIEKKLTERGVEVEKYNTTCPFVEKVWKRSARLGHSGHTLIVHGKHNHEETRATFSHASDTAPTVVLKDMAEALVLGKVITGDLTKESFFDYFKGKYSEGFDPDRHLQKVGVVNQTTMLATETQAIADYFKEVMTVKYGADHLKTHFADTRDTLCYATIDNQDATYGLLEKETDLAVVVGGYNSSNTSHIAELCERKLPTYFINSPDEIINDKTIRHFNYKKKERQVSTGWLPEKDPLKVVLTSGASCPDTLVDKVMLKIISYFDHTRSVDEAMEGLVTGQ